ncbi:SPOR domain-containing protein [Mariprofundus erugo]|uniref:SPOR domain-containing protein n=2 Tax=Mariprofundus erugo TaxID=2528639 RepID=A0A5R9GRE8_9PROT|nr:SPOR domain-containing protein [Mariprofundus erugo]
MAAEGGGMERCKTIFTKARVACQPAPPVRRKTGETMTTLTENKTYLLASAIALAAFIILFASLGGQHHSEKAPATKKAVSQLPPVTAREPEAAAIAAPEPADSIRPAHETITEPSPPASEPVETAAEQSSTDHAIIPADHSGPPWALNLMSLSSTNNMADTIKEVTAMGFTPEVAEVLIDDRHWFRIRIKGFATIRAAREAGKKFIDNKEYRTLWIGGYQHNADQGIAD